MASTAMAKKKETHLALMDDMVEDAGIGTDYAPDEMLIPFLRIAQPLSPEIDEDTAKFTPGLKKGDLFNTVTHDKWVGKEGVLVVPCYQVTKYLEFVPLLQGGGFRGEINPSDPVLGQTTRDEDTGKDILPNGNEVIKSDQHYCLLLDDEGGFQPIVVDMKITQLKVSRRWKTQIKLKKVTHPKTDQQITPALFASVWRLRVVSEENAKGKFYNYVVDSAGMVEGVEVYREAKAFHESVKKGEAKAVPEQAQPQGDSDIPF